MIYYEIKNKARVENQPVTTQPYNKLFPRKKTTEYRVESNSSRGKLKTSSILSQLRE